MNYLQLLESEVKAEKKRLSKQYRHQHRHFLRFLDVLMVMAFLFNMGALAMTNALVVKAEPDLKLYEANPVGAEMHGYETPEPSRAISALLGLFKHIMLWTILGFLYIYQRTTIYNDGGLYFLLFLTIYIFSVTSCDFFNNLGFLIGRVAYS